MKGRGGAFPLSPLTFAAVIHLELETNLLHGVSPFKLVPSGPSLALRHMRAESTEIQSIAEHQLLGSYGNGITVLSVWLAVTRSFGS
jgi:hypothetical protein